MSYPSRIEVLVVEDQLDAKAAYDTIFQDLRDAYNLAPPRFAFSFEEARESLASERIFHLVILDLRLPETRRMPPAEGISHGISLLAQCADRDRYPIPALLVVSAHVAATDQSSLRSGLKNDFYYGELVVKEYDHLRSEVESALLAVKRYVGVGVHIRETPKKEFPPLTPREDDLLRRFVLEREGRVGVDLAWWSAEKKASQTDHTSWAKVLMGRVLLDNGDRGRNSFFKFTASDGAQDAAVAAERMHQKLSHVKFEGALLSKSTSLIVTEKAGPLDAEPVSMATFLLGPPSDEEGVIQRVAEQIVSQVRALGELSADSRPLCKLLWKYHDRQRLERAIEAATNGEGIGSDGADPLAMLESLANRTESVVFDSQSFLHGDLHLQNIALDIKDRSADAFIFDAGATEPHVSVRDVAMLEASLLLHQADPEGGSLVTQCESLYATSSLLPDENEAGGTPLALRTYKLIRHLRGSLGTACDVRYYALMVFDAALIQLGGLDPQFPSNKIAQKSDAVSLACRSAAWLELVGLPG